MILAGVGLLMIVEGFFNVPALNSMASQVRQWAIIVAAFALGLAAVNLIRFHAVRLMRKQKGWYHNAACLAVMLAFAVGGILNGTKHPVYTFYYNNLYSPLATATMGLTIFFIATAAYRAIVIRNVEAGILLVAAVFIMLANVPIGEAIWSKIPAIANYINTIPNMAGQRGILITSAIGSIAFGLRVLLGLERTQFGAGAGGS